MFKNYLKRRVQRKQSPLTKKKLQIFIKKKKKAFLILTKGICVRKFCPSLDFVLILGFVCSLSFNLKLLSLKCRIFFLLYRPIHIAIANENLKMVQKLCQLMLKNKISLDITNYLRQVLFFLKIYIYFLLISALHYLSCILL